MEDIFGKILIFIKDEQVHQFLGLSKQYWDILTKLISRDGHQIELPQNQVRKDFVIYAYTIF
jgi:hypothetical protein